MADLFGYTPSQQIVDPSSPTIRVEPNLQAAKAFQSVGNLMDTVLQEKTNAVKRERMIQNEVDQLKNRMAAKARSEAAAKKEADKIQEDADFVKFNEDFTAMDADYENAYAAAGDNVDKQYEATAAVSLELKQRYASLTPAMQARVSNAVQGKLRTINERMAKAAQTSKVAGFYSDMNTNMPLVMQMDAEQEAAYYLEQQTKAKALGIPLNEMGEKYASTQVALLRGYISKNENDIIQNYNTKAVDDALAVIERVRKIDGNKAETLKAATDEFNGIRKKISDNAVSSLKQFAQDGDRTNFDLQFAIVQEIGELNTAELINLQQDFLNTYYSEKNVAERNVDAFIKRTGGTGSTLGMNTKEKNLFNAWLGQQIESQIVKGKIDGEFFRKNANNNPEEFAKSYKAGFQVGIGELKDLAHQFTTTKDEGAKQQLRGQIFQKVQQLNNLKLHANGVAMDKMLLQSTVAEALLTSSAIANIPEAMDKMNDGREVTLVSELNKDVKAIKDEVPDSYVEARELYSALIELKVPAEKAKETVIQRYSMNSIDGAEAEMSGAVVEYLNSLGMSQDAMEKWEPYLVDMLKANYPETSEDLWKLLKGTNPQAILEGNEIKYFNEEGSVVRLPFSRGVLKKTIDSMRVRQEDEENASNIGVFRIGPAIGNYIADNAYKKASAMMDVTAPVRQVVQDIGVGGILVARSVGKMSVSLASNLNQWVENVIVNDMPAAQANKLLSSALNKDASEVAKFNRGISKVAVEDMQEALDRATAAIKSGNLPLIHNEVSKLVNNIFDWMFPKAEASTMTPDISFVQTLKQEENGAKTGYSDVSGKWSPHPSPEGGTDTIAYGHKLTDNEVKTGVIMINGSPVAIKDGLTETQATMLFEQDLKVAEQGAAKKFGKAWKTMGRDVQLLATEIQYNVKGGLSNFPAFVKLASDPKTEKQAVKEISRTYTDDNGVKHQLTKRVTALTDWFNSVQ